MTYEQISISKISSCSKVDNEQSPSCHFLHSLPKLTLLRRPFNFKKHRDYLVICLTYFQFPEICSAWSWSQSQKYCCKTECATHTSSSRSKSIRKLYQEFWRRDLLLKWLGYFTLLPEVPWLHDTLLTACRSCVTGLDDSFKTWLLMSPSFDLRHSISKFNLFQPQNFFCPSPQLQFIFKYP